MDAPATLPADFFSKQVSPAPQTAPDTLPADFFAKQQSATTPLQGATGSGGNTPAPAPQPTTWDKIKNGVSEGFDLANPGIAITRTAAGVAGQKLEQLVEGRRQANLVAASKAKTLPYHEAANQFLQDMASTSQFVEGLGTPKNMALTAALMVPYLDVPASMYLVGEGTEQATKPVEAGETQADHYQRILSGLGEMAGGVAGAVKGAPKYTTMKSDAAAFKAEQQAKSAQTIRGLQQVRDAGMRELRHNVLESVNNAEEQGVKANVEKISAADTADIEKRGLRAAGIDVSDLSKEIELARDIYQQAGQATPRADIIGKRLANMPDKLTFEQAKQLRSDIYSAQKIAGPQAGILGKAYATLSDMMEKRARELGLPNAYANYNDTFRSLHSEGAKTVDTSLAPVIKDLAETPSEKLYDYIKAHPGQFDELQRSLQKFGLKPDIINKSVQDFDKAASYIKNAGQNAGFVGVLRSIIKRPLRAIAAYHVGHLAGGFAGGYVALSLLNDIAEHAEALAELKRLGGAPGPRDLLPQRPPDVPKAPVSGGATIGEQLAAKGASVPTNGSGVPDPAIADQLAKDNASKEAVAQSVQHMGEERRAAPRTTKEIWSNEERVRNKQMNEEMGIGKTRAANGGKMPEGMQGVLVDKGEPSPNPTREEMLAQKNKKTMDKWDEEDRQTELDRQAEAGAATRIRITQDIEKVKRGLKLLERNKKDYGPSYEADRKVFQRRLDRLNQERQGSGEAKEEPKDNEPIKVGFDEGGNIVDADGRHRIIEAIKRGDKRIPVKVKLRGGEEQVLNLDPKQVADMIGVTEESLKETDEQQAQFLKHKGAAAD